MGVAAGVSGTAVSTLASSGAGALCALSANSAAAAWLGAVISVAPAIGLSGVAALFGLEYKAIFLIEVNTACADCAVAVVEMDGSFEDVLVLCIFGDGRVRTWDIQDVAKLKDECLVV